MSMTDTAQGAQRRAQRLMQNAMKGHGVFMVKVGQVWAFPSLLAFSVGAFIKLGGDGLLPDGVATFGRIAATCILLVSGVLALEIAFFSIGSAISRRRVGLRIAWDGFLIVVVAPLETWTLYLLFTGQAVNGPVDLMRAAEAVVATVYLATLTILPPTDRDFVRVIGTRSAERAMEKLEMIPLDAVGMGRLYQVQAIANDESLSWSERAKRLVAAMEELAPGEQERAHQTQLAEMEAHITTAREEARRQMEAAQERTRQLTETAQRQVGEANERATQRALDAVLALVAGAPLPTWLTGARPELAGFTLASVAGSGTGRRSGGGSGGGKSSAGNTRVERQRAFLVEQGIEPSNAPEGRRGVWLRASDLATLTGGRNGSEKPQDLIRRLGDGATVGRNLVAPFEPVMRELSERHLLSDAARMWWTSQTHSGEDVSANQDEMSAASRADTRTNVIAMRA